jgi:chemotaxis protein CheY-P-specific phosphatase CheC
MYETELEFSVKDTGERMLFQDFARAAEVSGLGEALFWAKIEVSSPARFDLLMAAPDASAREIARLLFGEESAAESDQAVADLVAELANTVAGTMARQLSEEAHVVLSPPLLGAGSLPLARDAFQEFVSEDLHLLVAVASPA